MLDTKLTFGGVLFLFFLKVMLTNYERGINMKKKQSEPVPVTVPEPVQVINGVKKEKKL